jgi:small subunit ribosomal protein S15
VRLLEAGQTSLQGAKREERRRAPEHAREKEGKGRESRRPAAGWLTTHAPPPPSLLQPHFSSRCVWRPARSVSEHCTRARTAPSAPPRPLFDAHRAPPPPRILSHTPIPLPPSSPLPHSARYRGVGTDLSKVPAFARHANDVGSTEVQIARLSARVIQLTSHLQAHRKDFAATRGLMVALGQRRRLLRYLFKQDRAGYDRVIAGLGIRAVKVQASRGVMVKLGGGTAAAAVEE